jgi:hypothetical protein
MTKINSTPTNALKDGTLVNCRNDAGLRVRKYADKSAGIMNMAIS